MLRKCVRLLAGVGLAPLFFLALPSPVLAQTYLGSNLLPYAVFGGTGVTCAGASAITGDVGVSPAFLASITGFPAPCTATGTLLGSPGSDSAKANLVTAYGFLDGLVCSSTIGPDLAGLTLTQGVYCVTAAASNLTGLLQLDAQGNAAASWTFQMSSSLITSPGSTVDVINGGNDCSVQWLVRSSATIDTGTTFVGNVLALTSIAMNNGASLVGRVLARNAAVTLDNNAITFAPCAVGGGPVPTLATWALIGLLGLLGLAGFAALRGRQSLTGQTGV